MVEQYKLDILKSMPYVTTQSLDIFFVQTLDLAQKMSLQMSVYSYKLNKDSSSPLS